MSFFPKSFKGILFALLTIANVGLASFFAAVSLNQQCAFSVITSLLCFAIWVNEVPGGRGEDV